MSCFGFNHSSCSLHYSAFCNSLVQQNPLWNKGQEISSSFDKYTYMVKGDLPPCLREKSCTLRNSLITHTNLNKGLTGMEIFCLLHYTPHHMFLQWMSFKCLFITLRLFYMATGHTKVHGPALHSTSGFSSFTTPRGKLLRHSQAPQGLVFWWPPFFTAGRSCTNCAEPRGGGKLFHRAHFAAPSNTRGVSNKRLWITTHKF